MKKKSGLKRAVPIVSVGELRQLNTGALLARLQRLRFCEDSRERSDLTNEEISTVDDLILFKSDGAWKIAYRDLKEILATREHRSNKPS